MRNMDNISQPVVWHCYQVSQRDQGGQGQRRKSAVPSEGFFG